MTGVAEEEAGDHRGRGWSGVSTHNVNKCQKLEEVLS